MSVAARDLDELEQAKLDALKELAYGASHEINNPLANISARAQTLLRDERDPERRRALEAIQQQAMRAHEMISDLMLFARPPRLARAPVDVRHLLEQARDELAAECARRDVEMYIAADEALPTLVADESQLAVAVGALCRNALEAIGRRGRIDLRATTTTSGSHIEISVADDGPGIPDSVRPHMFDPFYSGREAGRGLGFGLSKCWRIVTEHGGTIAANNNSPRGANITLELPTGLAPERPA